MRRKRILVCDDQNLNFTRYRTILGDAGYDVVRSTHYRNVVADLERDAPVHLLWLDLGFDGSYIGHHSLPDLERAFPQLPVIIVSDILTKEAMSKEGLEIARELVRFPQVKAFLSAGDLAAKIVFDVDRVLGTPLWLRDDDLWILHLSDLQFGGKPLTHNPELLAKRLSECLESFVHGIADAAPEERRLPSVGFITGDLTQRGRPDEFRQAHKFLRAVSALLAKWSPALAGSVGSNNVLVIPGNHDVNWDISRARSIHLECGAGGSRVAVYRDGIGGLATELDYLWHYSWRPFIEFLDEFSGDASEWVWDPGFTVVNRAAELGLVIGQVNSARWSTTHLQHDAAVPADVWQELQKQLDEADPSRTAMRLLLVHHAVAETEHTSDRLRIGATGNVKELTGTLSRSCHFAAVFTGHVHDVVLQSLDTGSESRRLIAVGAGTLRAAATAEFRNPGFNLVRLGPRSAGRFEAITAYPFIWDGTRFSKYAAFEDGMDWKRREELR
jgi:CheY-like chemotaxis protein